MLIKMTYRDKNSTLLGNEIIVSNSPKQQSYNYYSKEEFKELVKKMLFDELESFKSIIFQKSYILSYVWSDTYKAHIDDKNEIYRFENLTYDNNIFDFNSFFTVSHQFYNERKKINRWFFNCNQPYNKRYKISKWFFNLNKEQQQKYIIDKIVSHIYCR